MNIDALREHLLDMDKLVTGANVIEFKLENGARFEVTGSGDVLKAIKTMVPAHTIELNKMQEYIASTEVTENGVFMTVESVDDKTIAKINGLVFLV